MSEVKMVRRILDGTYRLGDPWKLPKGAGFVLPILADGPYQERNYVLLQEVQGSVDFRDSGSISDVEVLNTTGRNVFIRKGTLLSGQGTQSRSPVKGVVVMPSKNFNPITVNCIHMSHHISSGSGFTPAGVAPHSVHQALGQQSETWESVTGYSRKLKARAAAGPGGDALEGIAEDNLVGVSGHVEGVEAQIDDFLSKIPGDYLNQVGIAVFNLGGVVGVEVFDHPESWKAFSSSITRSYREVLTEEVGELYDIRMDRAGPVLERFLEKLRDAPRTLEIENKVSKTWTLRVDDIEAELVEVEGMEIHIVIGVTDSPSEDQGMGGGGAPIPIHIDSHEDIDEVLGLNKFLSRRGGFNILDSLSEQAQRFTDLLGSVKASRGTIATRIREAEEMGLVEKAIRKENGSPAYKLTEEGKKAKKKGEEKVG